MPSSIYSRGRPGTLKGLGVKIKALAIRGDGAGGMLSPLLVPSGLPSI